jgi:hypothetical protein
VIRHSAIAEHSIAFYDTAVSDGNEFSWNNLPQVVNICGANINVVYTSRHKTMLCCTSVSTKVALDRLLMDNSIQNTGFFISLWNYFIACVIQDAPNKEQKMPVDCDQTGTVLPRPPERSGIIMLKLKRKPEFRGLPSCSSPSC